MKDQKTVGRPRKPIDQRLRQGSIRLKETQWEKVGRHGYDWLRSLIDNAPEEPKK